MKPTLSIVVISYNTREMTVSCIRSIFEQARGDDFEVIVLDNASNDSSAHALKSEFGDRIRLIESATNLGFAGGNNQAARNARGSYLLLLNPDTVVLDHAIDHLLDFARAHPDAGIWGGRTVFADGSLNPASCWRRTTVLSLACHASGLAHMFRRSPIFNPESYGGWARDSIRHVDIVSGCFFLIHRELWNELDGFDLSYFMYGEEADLCLRARAHGARPLITPKATIIHFGGASERVRADKIVRLFKAKSTLIKRHWPAYKVFLGLAMLASWPCSRTIFSRLLSLVGQATESSKVWQEVWSRRNEWLDGYPPSSS